jgi:hypothetical protein
MRDNISIVNKEANMKDIILAGTLMAAALGVFTPEASAQTIANQSTTRRRGHSMSHGVGS